MHVVFINLPRVAEKYFSSCGGYGSVTDFSVTPTFLLTLAKEEADKGNKVSVVDLQVNPGAEIPEADKIVTIMTTAIAKQQRKFLESLKKNMKKTKFETYMLPLEKIFEGKKLPRAMYELVDVQKYDVIDAYMSLYCPFRCTFCVKTMSGNPLLYKDLEDVISELKYLESKRVKKVTFSDPEFTLNKKRILDFAKLYKKNKLSIAYDISARADFLSEEVVTALKETNCYRVGLGIERPDDEELKKINKRLTYRQIKSAIKRLRRKGISVSGFFIFGFPWDDEKIYEKLRKRIMELDITTGVVNHFTPFPNTDVWKECVEYGLLKQSDKDKLELFGQKYAVCGTGHLTKEEVDKYTQDLNNLIVIKTKYPYLLFLARSRTLANIITALTEKIAFKTKRFRR